MSIRNISPYELQRLRQEGQTLTLIDVRTPVEFEQLHVEGACLIPLDQLAPQETPLCIICRSGNRSRAACEKLLASGHPNVMNLEGGVLAWEKAGLPVVRGTGKMLSLERQGRIAAGSLVLLGIVLGAITHPALYAISAFVGAGLVVAGATEWCGMALLLARMPWNRRLG